MLILANLGFAGGNSTGTPAALAGGYSNTAAVVGALTTAIQMAGDVATLAVATGSLASVVHALAGSVSSAAVLVGSLTSATRFAGDILSSAVVVGSLTGGTPVSANVAIVIGLDGQVHLAISIGINSFLLLD